MCDEKKLFLTLYFLSPLPLISVIYLSDPSYYASSGFIAMFTGTVAFTWFNLQLIISARPKWMESVFGLDRVFRFHSVMGVVAIVGASVHQALESLVLPESFQTQFGSAALAIFVLTALLALTFLIDTLVRNFKTLARFRKWVEKKRIGKYHVQKIIHNLTVVAVILAFVHVMLSQSAENLLVRVFYISYFGIAVVFYMYHKIIRRYFLAQTYVISQVIEETPSMCTLVMRPQNGGIFKYLPGQFAFIRIKDREISPEDHPFSITSEPGNPDNLSMTIKNLGDWTSSVPSIKPGSHAIIDGPYGRFSPLLYPREYGIVLIAGGVGITPMLSIIRYFYNNDREQKIVLFWGINTCADMFRKQEFENFERDMSHFDFIPVVAADKEYPGEKGYIDAALIDRNLSSRGYNPKHVQYYVCGPAIMQNKVIRALRSMGVPGKNIHNENFSF